VNAAVLAERLMALQEPAEVSVAGLSGSGWFSTFMSLRAFAKARPQLERLEVLYVEVVGSLV